MQAMIFAAGLGTRLRPFTNDRPKAMVEVAGKPLLEHAIRTVAKFGFNEIVVNVHHFAHQIVDFINSKNWEEITIHISDETDLLLDTGGGLKKAGKWLQKAPFLVYNTDIITNLNLQKLYEYHLLHRPLATLAVRNRISSRYLLFDDQDTLSGWRNTKTEAIRYCRPSANYHDFAFSGIHVIDPEIFNYMPEEAVFSIIDVYLNAGATRVIKAFNHSDSFWMDVGRVKDLERADEEINKHFKDFKK